LLRHHAVAYTLPSLVYIRDLLERYAIEVIPAKAKATQRGDRLALVNLRKVFGDMKLPDLEPQHIYKYADTRLDKKGNKSPSTGLHEIRFFKHAFTKAVEWGLIARHPFKGEVRLKGAKSRTRYVEDWEIVEPLALEPTRKRGSVLMIQGYIRIKLLLGIRRGDMLRIRMSDITDAGHRGEAAQDREFYRHRAHLRMDTRTARHG
jgi:integrase